MCPHKSFVLYVSLLFLLISPFLPFLAHREEALFRGSYVGHSMVCVYYSHTYCSMSGYRSQSSCHFSCFFFYSKILSFDYSDGRVNYHIADRIPLEKIVPCTMFYKYDLCKIKNIDIFVDGTLVVISV